MSRLLILFCFCLFAINSWAGAQSLFDIYLQALDKDPRVQIAEYKVDVAKAQFDQSTGQLLPQVNMYANFSDNEVDYDENTAFQLDQEYRGEKYSFVLRQTLFNWQALSNKEKMAELISQRESEQLDIMGILLVDVAQRYFDVLAAQNNLDLIRDEKQFVEEQVAQIEKMYERKLVRITDLLETQARADTVRSDEIDAENVLSISREALAELTGGSVGELFVFQDGKALPEITESMDAWVDSALANNPLLKSKHDNIAMATQNIAEQKGGHLPRVDLVFSDQISDVGFDNQQSPKRQTNYVGIDVTIPIFAGGGTSAKVREAYAEKYIAQEEMEGARREILKRTREAYLNTRAGLKRIRAAQLSKESAAKSYEAMRKSFSYGTVTAIDVLEARHKQTKATSDYHIAKYQFVSHYLSLKKEAGTINQDDLVEVNSWLQAPAK